MFLNLSFVLLIFWIRFQRFSINLLKKKNFINLKNIFREELQSILQHTVIFNLVINLLVDYINFVVDLSHYFFIIYNFNYLIANLFFSLYIHHTHQIDLNLMLLLCNSINFILKFICFKLLVASDKIKSEFHFKII